MKCDRTIWFPSIAAQIFSFWGCCVRTCLNKWGSRRTNNDHCICWKYYSNKTHSAEKQVYKNKLALSFHFCLICCKVGKTKKNHKLKNWFYWFKFFFTKYLCSKLNTTTSFKVLVIKIHIWIKIFYTSITWYTTRK